MKNIFRFALLLTAYTSNASNGPESFSLILREKPLVVGTTLVCEGYYDSSSEKYPVEANPITEQNNNKKVFKDLSLKVAPLALINFGVFKTSQKKVVSKKKKKKNFKSVYSDNR